MNQMMGSSATALSEFLGFSVNISTPQSFDIGEPDEFKEKYFPDAEGMVVVRFRLEIEEKLNSEFMNIMSTKLAKRLLTPFGLGGDDEDEEPAAEQPKEEPAAASTGGGSMSQEEMDALMASMGGSSAPEEEPAAASTGGGSMSQEEMDALMASMGSPAAPAEGPQSAPQAAPAMQPQAAVGAQQQIGRAHV